ncbi:hypothetical protein BY458DRAFT_501047 [Sporodiniella umbellata]|nr:hypothetical protein BY458DRAFT_501047 [Sporodiniella umbellata]
MPNPFSDPQIKILQEAFPDIDCSVIELAFWKAKGDMNAASEMLLEPDSLDIYQQPHYLTSNENNNLHRTRQPFSPSNTIKPPTVREELAQWRQELRRENCNERISNRSNRRSRSVFSLPSVSARLPYNPFANDSSFHASCTPPNLTTSLRRPLVLPTPNISIRPIHPSLNSSIHATRSAPSIPSLAPALPPRRPSHPGALLITKDIYIYIKKGLIQSI